MSANKIKTGWKVNTPALLNEVLLNPGTSAMVKPMQIFASVLGELATRAAELNDPKLNALMCRLALYEIADPYNANYDKELADKIIKEAYK